MDWSRRALSREKRDDGRGVCEAEGGDDDSAAAGPRGAGEDARKTFPEPIATAAGWVSNSSWLDTFPIDAGGALGMGAGSGSSETSGRPAVESW